MTAKPLPIFFALHDPGGSYWLNTAVALTSVAQYASGPIAVTVLHDDTLTGQARRRLTEIAARLGVPLTLRQEAVPEGLDAAILKDFSVASLFRLLLPVIAAEHELVVYLDSDLVANGLDICELIAATPPDAPLAAVVDPFITRIPAHAQAIADLGLYAGTYFNTGVLAIRPSLAPKTLMAEFVECAASGRKLIHPDQDFLNLRFRGQVHLLGEKFNTLVGYQDTRLLFPLRAYRGRILHYAGGIKAMCHALAPAFVPFFVHAYLTPEISQGELYDVSSYLFPVQGRPSFVSWKSIFRDPDAPKPAE